MSRMPSRRIMVPGQGLLPPAYEPQIPPDIAENETVLMMPPSPPWMPQDAADYERLAQQPQLQDDRYWRFDDALEVKLPDKEWIDDPGNGLPAFGQGGGLERVAAGSRIVFAAPGGKVRMPDLYGFRGMYVMGRRLLEAILAADAEGIVHKPAALLGSDGEPVPGEWSFVDVVRNLPLVDVANSVVAYTGPSGPYPAQLSAIRHPRLRDDIDPSLHIMRQLSFASVATGRQVLGRNVVVSDALRRTLEAAVPAFKNLMFRPVVQGL